MRSALLSPWSDDFLRKYASYMNLQQREPESDYFTVFYYLFYYKIDK